MGSQHSLKQQTSWWIVHGFKGSMQEKQGCKGTWSTFNSGKISLLFTFRTLIRSLLQCSCPALACCLCWSHSVVRASCCSCCSLSLLPAPELLENYSAKQHEGKGENPRISPLLQMRRNTSLLSVQKKIKLTLLHLCTIVFK